MPAKRYESQRTAEARYDRNKRRRSPISGRLTDTEKQRLEQLKQPGESDFPALKRLAGIADKQNKD